MADLLYTWSAVAIETGVYADWQMERDTLTEDTGIVT
jgi:hypothetical protein